jgi:hypothetical protein
MYFIQNNQTILGEINNNTFRFPNSLTVKILAHVEAIIFGITTNQSFKSHNDRIINTKTLESVKPVLLDTLRTKNYNRGTIVLGHPRRTVGFAGSSGTGIKRKPVSEETGEEVETVILLRFKETFKVQIHRRNRIV